MQIETGTAMAIGTIIFSIGGAWAMVKGMQKKVQEAVMRAEYEDFKVKAYGDYGALKRDLSDEIRTLKQALFDSRGQSIYQPRTACGDEKLTWTQAIAALSTKLDAMDGKRDVARVADLLSMRDLKESVALIKQRFDMMDADNAGRK